MMNHRPLSKPQFRRALRLHQLWVETGGSQGDPASLQGVNIRALRKDLKGAILQSADLRCADLQYTNLQGADLQGADLKNAYLSYSDLRNAQFDINIRDCFSFRRAKFTPDALPWLILHPEWADLKDTVQIEAEAG